jgi:hypothetical protein
MGLNQGVPELFVWLVFHLFQNPNIRHRPNVGRILEKNTEILTGITVKKWSLNFLNEKGLKEILKKGNKRIKLGPILSRRIQRERGKGKYILKKMNVTFLRTSKKMNLMMMAFQIMKIISLIRRVLDLWRIWNIWRVMGPMHIVLTMGKHEGLCLRFVRKERGTKKCADVPLNVSIVARVRN